MASNSFLVTVLVYVSVAAAAFLLLSAPVSSMPLEDESAEMDDKNSLLLTKYMSLLNRLQDRRTPGVDLNDVMGMYKSQQKRYRSPMQSRSGGMSLCLWKVCPAAPWLISK